MTNFDDRLEGHDRLGHLMEAAEAIAHEMAQEHYEQCYGVDYCHACIEDTPVSGGWGPWLGKKAEFDALVDSVESRVESLNEDPTFVPGVLRGEYIDSFRDSGVEPADCVVCTDPEMGDVHACGHEKYGDECPVTP